MGALGEIHLLEGTSDEIRDWYTQLPEEIQNDPAIWYVRGLWAEQLDEHEVTVRCFWESARQTPTSYRAIHQVGRVLSELEPEPGKEFAKWGEDLHQMQQILSKVLDSRGQDETALQSLVEKLINSGREWEAWSWTVMAQNRYPRSTWPKQDLQRNRMHARQLRRCPRHGSRLLGRWAVRVHRNSARRSRGGGAGLGVIAFRAHRPVSQTDGTTEGEDAPGSPSGLNTRLSLFIANDQDSNFFLQSLPTSEPPGFELVDESFIVGLAMNRDGRTTACMGVAAGDITEDGRLDLFVTNFKNESNTFFVQGEGGLFMDSVSGSGLLLPGWPYVGWGTQFLDPDNDGRLDIVVANGHVGDFAQEGIEYRMPTQVFRNLGQGRFEELGPDGLGAFFQKNRIGRAVATLDWNRDGLMDFVLSPLDENVALLTNRTKDTGHWVGFRLHGTTSPRDAVGAIVTVVTEGKTIRHQLLAGDGYQATNERILRFGLGQQDSIREVVI